MTRAGVRQRGQLLELFWPLSIAQPHTRTAAVLVDEKIRPLDIVETFGFVLQKLSNNDYKL